MRRGEVIDGVAVKRLAKVDLPHLGSNQHEIGGVAALRELLGTDGKASFPVTWVGLEGGADPRFDTGTVTFSDVRRDNPNRSPEWHLYYTGEFLAAFDVGDTLWIARQSDNALVVVVAEQGSEWDRGCAELFGIRPQDSAGSFRAGSPEITDQRLGFAAGRVAELLGLAEQHPGPDAAEIAAERFPGGFPAPAELSRVARETCDVSSDDPDELLVMWYEHERSIFAAIEHRLVSDRIELGFEDGGGIDVEAFISFSLSVQNRRKSRAGSAFESHLAAIFRRSELDFDHGVVTERRSKPDFLFPGQGAYQDPGYPVERLRMLAAKTSCKERWRQVLAEADRIERKHLVTLEPGISANQLSEMNAQNLVLVVPRDLHAVYPQTGTGLPISLAAFIEDVATTQR